MKIRPLIAATAIVLFGATTAAAQGNRQVNPQAAPQQRQTDITIPSAQQSQQQQQQTRTRQPMEQQPQLNTTEPAQPQFARRGPAPEEKSSVTHHSGTIDGTRMNYTATAATYVLKADDSTPKATFFFVAYTKDDVPDQSKRPLSFVYNGGPGSASLFTHMGMGPKHVVLTPDGHGTPAPYLIEDNPGCSLGATDMVFVDAISTGFSRPAPGENPAQFHGIIADANTFADFIYQYITRTGRWDSPKYLIGESYGTTRSAELAGVLQQRHQIYLNGIVLLSSVAFSNWGGDERSAFFLPTYITTAWYHHLLPADLQSKSISEIAQMAREFAHGEYARALDQGDRIPAEDYQKTVRDTARFTGLSPKYIEQSNLRVSPFRWFKELEREKRRTIGRLDSRFEGMDVDAAGERNEYDSSEASYEGAYVATFHDYVHRDLKWNSDQYYTVTANVRPWDQTGDTQVAEVLRSAITQQTHLKVLVLCGYYDVATPFNGIEHTVNHMHLEPPLRNNVSFAYYETGHMIYIDQKANDKLRRDIDGFINGTYSH